MIYTCDCGAIVNIDPKCFMKSKGEDQVCSNCWKEKFNSWFKGEYGIDYEKDEQWKISFAGWFKSKYGYEVNSSVPISVCDTYKKWCDEKGIDPNWNI